MSLDGARRLPRRAGAGIAAFGGVGSLQAVDFRVVEIAFLILPVRGNVSVIIGAGGNITVQTGEQGILLVDTGIASMSEKVWAAVQSIAPPASRSAT